MSLSAPKVGIVIRTKNEEMWIGACLTAIFSQNYPSFEVVLVDNLSTDLTVRKASRFNLKSIVSIENFLPGAAINLGIEQTDAELIALISAHCIPSTDNWLSELVQDLLSSDDYAGCYGKQLPMTFTAPQDKRDLYITFGDDYRQQVKDPFFHNANSIVRRELLLEYPFDNSLTNIEDRAWASTVQSAGYQILYTPRAHVYHYHGIHQTGNKKRLQGVSTVIQSIESGPTIGRLQPSTYEICSVIPVRGEAPLRSNFSPLKNTINTAFASKYINRVFVATDNPSTAELAVSYGAEVIKLRPPSLSNPQVSIEEVHVWHLSELESTDYFPDFIVNMEITFPFRPRNIVDDMFCRLLDDGATTIVASKNEPGWVWLEDPTLLLNRVDSGDLPREFKEKLFVAYHGICCISHVSNIRNGSLLGNRTSLFALDDSYSSIELRTNSSIDNFLSLFPN